MVVKIVDTNKFTQQDWEALTEQGDFGTHWIPGDGITNWCRFLNHNVGERANCSVATTADVFGNSFAVYTNKPIQPGEELFYNYGRGYWL